MEFSDQAKVAGSHSLHSVVKLTHFLRISVCRFLVSAVTDCKEEPRVGIRKKVAYLRVTSKTKSVT